MLYREQIPRPELRPYINCFWMIRSPGPVAIGDRTLPDGCQEIVFNVNTRVLRRDCGGEFTLNPAAELVGQMTRPYEILTRGSQLFFGIKFLPHSFSLFTRESIHNLRDQSIDLRDLFSPGFDEIIDRVFERPEFERFIALMEACLLRKLQLTNALDRGYRLVDRAVRALFSAGGPLLIDELCANLGVSDRYLQQMFKQRIGLGPKQLLKMIRFQRTLQYLTASNISLTELAHRSGYCDHAHFTRDFRSLAGVSPSEYRQLDTPLTGFFLTENSRAYLCNLQYPS
jgi:AraC-like DNA-binding protein